MTLLIQCGAVIGYDGGCGHNVYTLTYCWPAKSEDIEKLKIVQRLAIYRTFCMWHCVPGIKYKTVKCASYVALSEIEAKN